MRIKDIQNWERNFSKKKGINFKKEEQIKIAVFKLTEEVGEVSKAILENRWNEVQAEVSDVIIFACKVANIVEDFYQTDKLENVLKRKIGYCEKRTFDERSKKFNKPKNKEFK
jgi:NTP pyrophosphatase (non-canonical NTP hydrolase)